MKKIIRNNSAIYELLQLIKRWIKITNDFPKIENKDRLVGEVVKAYLENINTIDHLSKAYGFKYACFWQPMTYLESYLTEEEKIRAQATRNIQNKNLIGKSVHKLLKTGVVPNFYNISDALKDRKEPVYLDVGHVTEKGNEIISQRICEILITNYLEYVKP